MLRASQHRRALPVLTRGAGVHCRHYARGPLRHRNPAPILNRNLSSACPSFVGPLVAYPLARFSPAPIAWLKTKNPNFERQRPTSLLIGRATIAIIRGGGAKGCREELSSVGGTPA